MTDEARMDERVEEMPYPEDTGRTHYEGCYRHRRHHNCAVAKVDALLDRLQAAEERVEALERTFLHDHKAGEESLDRCERCGLDIRDEIHRRREQ